MFSMILCKNLLIGTKHSTSEADGRCLMYFGHKRKFWTNRKVHAGDQHSHQDASSDDREYKTSFMVITYIVQVLIEVLEGQHIHKKLVYKRTIQFSLQVCSLCWENCSCPVFYFDYVKKQNKQTPANKISGGLNRGQLQTCFTSHQSGFFSSNWLEGSPRYSTSVGSLMVIDERRKVFRFQPSPVFIYSTVLW